MSAVPDLRVECHCNREPGGAAHWHSLMEGCSRESTPARARLTAAVVELTDAAPEPETCGHETPTPWRESGNRVCALPPHPVSTAHYDGAGTSWGADA